jgi:hypothetical protein
MSTTLTLLWAQVQRNLRQLLSVLYATARLDASDVNGRLQRHGKAYTCVTQTHYLQFTNLTGLNVHLLHMQIF